MAGSISDDAGRSAEPWGRVGAVVLTVYDQLGTLEKLGKEVRGVLALLSGLGFVPEPELAGDGHAPTIQRAIGEWQPAARRLVLYWAGHGKALATGEMYLCTRETLRDREPESFHAISARDLGNLLAGKDVGEIVLIVDTCGSGGGARDIVTAFRDRTERRAFADGFKPGLAVISSAGRHQQAREGAFSRAMTAVLRDGAPADPSYLRWTDRDQFISPTELFQAVRVELGRQGRRRSAQVPDYDMTSGVGRFFPNPRFRKLPDIEVEEKERRGALLSSAVSEHFMLKFRGIDTVDDQGWFFSGRERVLTWLTHWLAGESSGMVVVTGGPGCGKSALLGRLAVLSVPDYRDEIAKAGGLADAAPDTIPPAGSLDAGVHATNLTLVDCVAELADALDLPRPSGGLRSGADFVRQVAGMNRPVTIMLDALDEAQPADVRAIVMELLRPLTELPKVKVLVGTRPDQAGRAASAESSAGGLLRLLGQAADRTFWLDQEVDTTTDITEYVRRRLLASPDSPYHGRRKLAAAAAEAISQRSDRTFLVARLLSRALLQHREAVDLSDPDKVDWRDFSGGVAEAFALDLARYGDQEWRVRALLRPLAWAEGSGLPSREVWLALAETLRPDDDGRPLIEADVHWLLGNAGAYLVESSEDGQTVYRLYHQALGEHLIGAGDVPDWAVQAQITDNLLALVPTSPAGRYWNIANPYVLRHLATHAAQAGRLADLLEDSRFLLYAEPQRLRRALAAVDPRGSALVRLYLRCADAFTDADPTRRAELMQGVALRDEPAALAMLNTGHELPWRGRWSSGRRAGFHRRLPSHASPVTAVAFGSVRRTSMLATAGGDGAIRLWNAVTGEQWDRLKGGGGAVFALAFDRSGLRRLLVAGTQEGTVQFWDPATGAAVRTIQAHAGPVFAVAVAETPDGALLATAGEDGSIRLWDPDNALSLGTLTGHHTAVRTLAFGAGPILVSGGDDGRVRVWDPLSGRQLRSFQGTSWIYAADLGHVDERTVLATASAFGAVRLWDVHTGQHLSSFVGHDGPVNAVAFGTRGGRTVLATGGDDGEIRLWDPRDGSEVQTLTRGAPFHGRAHTLGRAALAIGTTVGTTTDPDASPEDLAAGIGRGTSVQALAWDTATSGSLLASGDGDWMLRLWDPNQGQIDEADHPVGLVLGLAIGRVQRWPVVIAACQDGRIRCHDVVTGLLLSEWNAHRGAVNAIAAGRIGGQDVVVSAGSDGEVALWNAMTGAGIRRWSVRGPESRAASAVSVAIAEVDGRTMVAAAGANDEVPLWDAQSGRLLRRVPGSAMAGCVTFGRVHGWDVLISGGVGGVMVAAIQETRGYALLSDSPRRVRDVAFGEVDGREMILTVGLESPAQLWDLETEKPVRRMAATSYPTTAVALGKLGDRPVAAAGSRDGTVRLWNASTGEPLGRLADHDGPVTSAIFVASGAETAICTGGLDGIHFINLAARLTRSDPRP